MATRTIRHASFSYSLEAEDPIRPGETIYIERRARRGDQVEIPLQADLDRGARFGAFLEEGQALPGMELPSPTAPADGEGDIPDDTEESVRNLTDDELVSWIQEDKPTVQEVIDASEGDATQARRLLDAEDKATDGDSRQGVIKGLTAVIGNAG